MANTKRYAPPVPPDNQPQAGPPEIAAQGNTEPEQGAGGGAPFQEQDPQRRLGGFESAGEHPRQQPTRLNDGQ